jgi:hypothetical protein
MKLGKYSLGIGDRFNHEGKAQLRAIIKAKNNGIDVTPVWNKSNREHNIVHSEPEGTRIEADEAVRILEWEDTYCVDADHINLSNVDRFIDHADFFTLDVAMYIGNASPAADVEEFIELCIVLGESVSIPGIDEPIVITEELLKSVAGKYLAAVKEAGKIYRHIVAAKGVGNFVTEVSMDEVETPQTPVELFFILKMIADERIPAQTIAPKFTGRFNKGVDYVGDVEQFAKEFEQDLFVIDFAINEFGLPEDLKLSVHSGSDKFTIYPVMAEIIKKHNKGIHVKTAGTTWLEEVIGLSISGNDGLAVVKEIYIQALARKDELCAPYADVIDIDDSLLPTPEEVSEWSGKKFADTLRHIPGHPDYNSNLRQLIHVGYKVAAEMGTKYTGLLEKYADVVGSCVEENIYDRHLKRLFNL